jgi:hypothetical protein
MKKLILKFLFLFYHYYDKGSTKPIAYFSALTALIMVLFLNVFAMLIYLDVINRNPDYSIRTPMSIKYLIGFILFIPIVFILKKIFKKEDILKIEMDKSTMRKGYFIIVSYIILSMVMLIYIIQNK